jgi:formyl-CoA transferase
VDIALYEAVFNMMEGAISEYDRYGLKREPAGSALPGVAPTNAYPTEDGRYVLIAGNADSIFKRLMTLIGRQDLAEDPTLARNPGRVARQPELDAAIGAWTQQRSLDNALAALAAAKVPAGKVFTIEDIADSDQYQARGMVRTLRLGDGSDLKVPGVVPKLSLTPGDFRGGGPALGQHTVEALARVGVTNEQLEALRAQGVIA